MRLALSILCENPHRRTGLTTFFKGLVGHALAEFPEVNWVVFAGPEQAWDLVDSRVEVCRNFPANDRLASRLWADHFLVAAEARRRGAAALLTIGFVPWRAAGLPVAMQVITLHHRGGGAGAADRLRAAYRAAVLRSGLRCALLVIANSRWTAAQLGVEGAAVLVSPEGVDHEKFSSTGARGATGLPENYLLWAGNFYTYKRADLALAAYARLAPELRAQWPLVLVGGDWQGGRARAEAAARTLGVAADTRFLGWVDDAVLPAIFRGARAQVLATSEETFGRSLAEGMACGCPAVVQDLPVLREVAGEAAVYCDFADTEAAAAALTAMCTDDGLVARLSAAGVVRAAEFSYARLARERVGAVLAMLEGRL